MRKEGGGGVPKESESIFTVRGRRESLLGQKYWSKMEAKRNLRDLIIAFPPQHRKGEGKSVDERDFLYR